MCSALLVVPVQLNSISIRDNTPGDLLIIRSELSQNVRPKVQARETFIQWFLEET